MKVVIAIDSFKGSLTSMQAGRAAAEGIRRACADAEIVIRPIADGGEGTVDALVEGMNGEKRTVCAKDPLGRSVLCEYGILGDRKTAVIEMAAAAGLTRLTPAERDPLYTTTYGVGELIRDAVLQGCRSFILGIGGSATNDGGAGMLQALGFELLDRFGNPIPYGAVGLCELAEIREEHVLPELSSCTFRIACDVTNPLCGTNGCSAVFGPQKGATDESIAQMDGWLSHYANIVKRIRPNADPQLPGAGAAGGLGFACASFLNGTLRRGIDLILEATDLASEMNGADLVITGEGRLDGQTAMGKAPMGVASLAKRYGTKVIALAGSVTEEARACLDGGIDAYFPILRGICSLEEAVEPNHAYRNMADTAEQVLRLLCLA